MHYNSMITCDHTKWLFVGCHMCAPSMNINMQWWLCVSVKPWVTLLLPHTQVYNFASIGYSVNDNLLQHYAVVHICNDW